MKNTGEKSDKEKIIDQANKEHEPKEKQTKDQLEKEIVETVVPDARFKKKPEKTEKQENEKALSKKFKKNIKKEERLKKYYSVINKVKSFTPDFMVGFIYGFLRLLDFLFNVFVISSIVIVILIVGYKLYYSAPPLEIISGCILLVVLIWLNDRMS